MALSKLSIQNKQQYKAQGKLNSFKKDKSFSSNFIK